MTMSIPLKPSESLKDELFASMAPDSDLHALERTLQNEELRSFAINLKNEDKRNLLHAAAAAANERAVKLLLEAGADAAAADESDWTPLHIASSVGAPEIVLLLLNSKGEKDEKINLLEQINESGSKPIHYAASRGHIRVLEVLLQHGADVNAKGFGNHTALSRAIAAGRDAVVSFLLTVPGVDLTVKEKVTGDNLLHIAVNSEKPNIYWEIAQMAPQLEDEKNAEGAVPIASASRTFMKQLEAVIKESREDSDLKF